jgi:hypothetical protein
MNKVLDQVWSQVLDQVGLQVRLQVRDQVGLQVRDQVQVFFMSSELPRPTLRLGRGFRNLRNKNEAT